MSAVTNARTPESKRALKPWIQSVDANGVTIERPDGTTASCSWDALRDAARQDDPDLRAAYAALLRRAEDLAIDRSPLIVRYGQDTTNVWWHAWVETAWGGVYVGRTWRGLTIVAADEGGTLAHAWMAESDAHDIAARIGRIAPNHEVRVERVRS